MEKGKTNMEAQSSLKHIIWCQCDFCWWNSDTSRFCFTFWSYGLNNKLSEKNETTNICLKSSHSGLSWSGSAACASSAGHVTEPRCLQTLHIIRSCPGVNVQSVGFYFENPTDFLCDLSFCPPTCLMLPQRPDVVHKPPQQRVSLLLRRLTSLYLYTKPHIHSDCTTRIHTAGKCDSSRKCTQSRT